MSSNNINNTTKTLGIIIMLIGMTITLYTGFNSVPSENVVYSVELTADKENNVNWSPFAGIGVYIIGGVFYFADRKKTVTQDHHSYNKSLHF